jgi:Z1 domain
VTDLLERMSAALGAMTSVGPRSLRAYLHQPGPDFERSSDADVDLAIDEILAADPNNPSRLKFSNLLRSWDNTKEANWTGSTARNTAQRRKLIHQLLKSDPELVVRIDELIPFYNLEEPLIIAERHQDWYSPQAGVRDYYWSTYIRYLRERRDWDDASLFNMDNSTRAIVECLANPEAKEVYASRGLVMGYVQSGKTANFTGVVAKAADAGYRLLIVLAGTWNILRNQTQRRFDKELLGKELLVNDETYSAHPPPDWSEFLEHGADPVELGHFTWQRLTRPDIDFRRLKSAIDNLEFERGNKAVPIYSPINLHNLPVKLLVVKKHSGILANLVKDLKLIRTKLTDLPTLIIDDESDQAGLNTVDPRRALASGADRSKTNLRIVELLELFPRGQYVGYTATPYANALVDPDDPKDLFPKDFIISLDRPRGYMGVSDFFDPTTDYEDLDKEDYSQSEIAHIRRVEKPAGEDGEDLKKALRSYVLAGSVKLYRHSQDPRRYKAEHLRHHTMLVHTSPLTGEQASIAGRLEDLWNQCAFKSPKGLVDLENLWSVDYAKVCAAKGSEVTPGVFKELIPHLSEAIKRIEKGPKLFLVVNSDTAEAPDFSAAPVWKIVIGGNKLSRGYTVEGLTVSYYRRVAGTADTLMQMGRWFGFRPGYQDLVRVFLGVKEGKRSDSDLVSLFKEVCRMEERFRQEIRQYARRPGVDRITPKQIPPLISVSGTLPPTAGNKMFNAILASKNFGGQRSMLTLAPTKPKAMGENVKAVTQLLAVSKALGKVSLGGIWKGKAKETEAAVYEATNKEVINFLARYHWLESEYIHPERPTDTSLQMEFLEKQRHGIASWLVVAPQRQVSFGDSLIVKGVGSLTVKERHRIEGRGFQVFGEPFHRAIAEFLIEIEPGRSQLVSVNRPTKELLNVHRGVLLLYPVRQHENDEVTIGFELLFPKNGIPFDINFTVRRKSEKAAVVVKDTADA